MQKGFPLKSGRKLRFVNYFCNFEYYLTFNMKIIISFFLLCSQVLFSQKESKHEIPICKLDYKLNTENLAKNNTFDFIITNRENINIKIINTFPNIRIQAINVSSFDENMKKFVPSKTYQIDVNSVSYKEKFISLKTNQTKIYTINIKDLYLLSKVLDQEKKYKFNLWIDTIDLIKYKNIKCYPNDFVSEPIIITY